MSYDSEKGFAQQEVKQNIGRGSFIRTKHEGSKANPTEWKASKRLGKGDGPTPTEIEDMIDRNPTDYKIYKSQGMSDKEIYDILG